MGLHDRPYWQDEGGSETRGVGGRFARHITPGMARPPSAVKLLLIANLAVFVLQLIAGRFMLEYFTVYAPLWWQVWRLLTFQFLHADPMHLIFNMIGLYFLGTLLERQWGSKEFARFYLACGAFAGVCHLLLAWIFGVGFAAVLLGASGGVYAILVACAVLFPHLRLYIYFLFPVSIRLVAIVWLAIATLSVVGEVRSALGGGGGGMGGTSNIAHLGGAVAAAFWIWVLPSWRRGLREARQRQGRGAWQRRMEARRREQQEIDRILDKINRQGLESLTGREKRFLRDATRRQREQEQELHKL